MDILCPIDYVFATWHWMRRLGITYKKNSNDKVSPSSSSQISYYALMKCMPLIAGIHSYS